jgi:hypothetical protein
MAAWIDKAGSSPNCFIAALHFSQMRLVFESAGFKPPLASAMIAAPVLPIDDREVAYAARPMRWSVSVAAAMIKGHHVATKAGRSESAHSGTCSGLAGICAILLAG